MNFDAVTALVSLILGTGMSTAVAGVIRYRDRNQKRKIESEDTLLSRYESENRRAKLRADEAEEEAEKYRQQRDIAHEDAARFKRMLIENGIPLPIRDDAR